MKIKKIDVVLKNLALTKPYAISYKTISDVENVFLIITLENGIKGIGAANPDPQLVGESPANVYTNCQSDFCQSLVGRDIRNFRMLIHEISIHFPGNPGTLAVWDIALHDAFGKFIDMPIVYFYGKHLSALPTSVTIGIMNVEDTLIEAESYQKMGFKILKVKTGNDVSEDLERLSKIAERFSDLTIRIDANQGYSVEDLKKFITATRNFNLEIIEQPLPVGREKDLLNLEPVQRHDLVADESLKDSKSALEFAESPMIYGIYNIKLMKCGGLLAAFDIATIARTAGIDLFWGCNDESIVSITAALHAAFASPNTKYIDLDGSLDLAEDLVSGGFVLEDGMMSINNHPGFGYCLD